MFRKKKDSRKLGEKLVQAGKMSSDELLGLLEQQRVCRRFLGEMAVEGGFITDDELQSYLPKEVAKRRSYAMSERNSLHITENFLLQTALKFTLFSDDPIRTLLVTSALPGEGKTMTSNYLARTIARVRPGRFLLVDGDLINPTLHTRNNLPQIPGWTDYMVESNELDECLCPTEVENLHILPAGSLPPNPGALFASKRMTDFTEELKERFELVIFDSPPLIPVTVTAILGSKLDAAVVVVKAGSTKRQVVKKATDLLAESRTRIIGIVMNQVVSDEYPRSGYYGGYGSYGGYYGKGYYGNRYYGDGNSYGPKY